MKTFNKIVSVFMSLVILMTFVGLKPVYAASPVSVDLGISASYTLLTGAGSVSNVGTTSLAGDVGLDTTTGTLFNGFSSVAFASGAVHDGDLSYKAANYNFTSAYFDAASRTGAVTLSGTDNQLGGQTLAPDLYTFDSASVANLSGNLTLDAAGDPNAVWIFQATLNSSGINNLITADLSTVTLVNGAQASNVFWLVYGDVTLGAGSTMVGSVMTDGMITVGAGSTVNGRLLSLNGNISLDSDTVNAGYVVQSPDTTPPVIILNGSDPVDILVNTPYTDAGAGAFDNVDGDITGSIVVDATAVDTTAIGSYSVMYNATDAAGNTASVSRTVNVDSVLPDVTPPVITILGANPLEILVGTPYVEYGATAVDNVDGNVTANIVINSSTVDVNTVGTYYVDYLVADSAGNSTLDSRVVNVVAVLSKVGDINGDGFVDLIDLAMLGSVWNTSTTGPEDLNHDGVVDLVDLAMLGANWMK